MNVGANYITSDGITRAYLSIDKYFMANNLRGRGRKLRCHFRHVLYAGMIGLLIALNLSDLCFTLYALSLGYSEANPLLQNPGIMAAYKLVAVPMMALVLHKAKAKKTLTALTVLYGVVTLWHIYGLFIM